MQCTCTVYACGWWVRIEKRAFQVYKWVLVNLMLWATRQCPSISSAGGRGGGWEGSRNTSSCFMLLKFKGKPLA